MLRSLIRWLWNGGRTSHLPATYHSNEFGLYYAKVPAIAARPRGPICPLLRKILTEDLKCGKIVETSGLGHVWWDFAYKRTDFTCDFLLEECGGSEIYPAIRTTAAEQELLRELVDEITFHAIRRTG